MDDNELADQADRVLNLSFSQAALIISNLGHLGLCRHCGKGNYALNQHNGRATVVCLSLVPTKEELAHWSFYAACTNCGEVKLIDAAHVACAADEEAQK